MPGHGNTPHQPWRRHPATPVDERSTLQLHLGETSIGQTRLTQMPVRTNPQPAAGDSDAEMAEPIPDRFGKERVFRVVHGGWGYTSKALFGFGFTVKPLEGCEVARI